MTLAPKPKIDSSKTWHWDTTELADELIHHLYRQDPECAIWNRRKFVELALYITKQTIEYNKEVLDAPQALQVKAWATVGIYDAEIWLKSTGHRTKEWELLTLDFNIFHKQSEYVENERLFSVLRCVGALCQTIYLANNIPWVVLKQIDYVSYDLYPKIADYIRENFKLPGRK